MWWDSFFWGHSRVSVHSHLICKVTTNPVVPCILEAWSTVILLIQLGGNPIFFFLFWALYTFKVSNPLERWYRKVFRWSNGMKSWWKSCVGLRFGFISNEFGNQLGTPNYFCQNKLIVTLKFGLTRSKFWRCFCVLLVEWRILGNGCLAFLSIEAFLPYQSNLQTEVTLRNAAISLICSCVPFSALG